MSTVFPQANYQTTVTALANTNKTTVFSVNAAEESVSVTSISINDATGSAAAGPVIVYITLGTGITERVFLYRATDLEADWPLEIIGRPIHLKAGGTIAVTADNNVNVWVSWIINNATGADAQRR